MAEVFPGLFCQFQTHSRSVALTNRTVTPSWNVNVFPAVTSLQTCQAFPIESSMAPPPPFTHAHIHMHEHCEQKQPSKPSALLLIAFLTGINTFPSLVGLLFIFYVLQYFLFFQLLIMMSDIHWSTCIFLQQHFRQMECFLDLINNCWLRSISAHQNMNKVIPGSMMLQLDAYLMHVQSF